MAGFCRNFPYTPYNTPRKSVCRYKYLPNFFRLSKSALVYSGEAPLFYITQEKRPKSKEAEAVVEKG
jgi:hypothetical protein